MRVRPHIAHAFAGNCWSDFAPVASLGRARLLLGIAFATPGVPGTVPPPACHEGVLVRVQRNPLSTSQCAGVLAHGEE